MQSRLGVLLFVAGTLLVVSAHPLSAQSVPSDDPERQCPPAGKTAPAGGATQSGAGKKAHEIVRMGATGEIEYRCIPSADGETPKKIYCNLEGDCKEADANDLRRVGDLISEHGTPGELANPSLTQVKNDPAASFNTRTIAPEDFMYHALGDGERSVGVEKLSDILFSEGSEWGEQVASYDQRTLAANMLDNTLDSSTRPESIFGIVRPNGTLADIAAQSLVNDRYLAETGLLQRRIPPPTGDSRFNLIPTVPLDEFGRPRDGPLVAPRSFPPRAGGYSEREWLAVPPDRDPFPAVEETGVIEVSASGNLFRSALERFYMTSNSFIRGVQGSLNTFWDRWI